MKELVKDFEFTSQGDPFIFEYNKEFYLYTTNEDGVMVFKGDHMDNFHKVGFCLENKNEKAFWAPCIVYNDGLFYLYYSSMPKDSNDVHDECIKVAVSKYPDRNFEYKETLLAPFSIDSHVVQNQLGEWYIFYSINNYTDGRIGTYIVVDKMKDLLHVEGKCKKVLSPTLDEEIFMRDRFEKGKHWHTLEGAFYIYDNGVHYLMYSGNCYQNENYYIGYATSFSESQDLRELTFTKYPDNNTYKPLLCKNKILEGTGHNSAIKKDNKWYIVYHARYKNQVLTNDSRRAFISKMNLENGVITIDDEILK